MSTEYWRDAIVGSLEDIGRDDIVALLSSEELDRLADNLDGCSGVQAEYSGRNERYSGDSDEVRELKQKHAAALAKAEREGERLRKSIAARYNLDRPEMIHFNSMGELVYDTPQGEMYL